MLSTDIEQERAVVELVGQVLGEDVIAVHRHGSAVTGDLQHFSDLDLLVVTNGPVTATQRQSLVHGLLAVSGPESGALPRPVELTVIVAGDVRPWQYPARVELQYGEWLREQMTAGYVPGPGPDPDLALLLSAARRHSVALIGPPAETLFDAVPAADLHRAITAGLPALLDESHHDTRNVVLTLARMLVTAETGQIVSKIEAADRVLPRLPSRERDLLALARAAHNDQRQDLSPNHPALDDLTARMARAIRAAL